ncbi:MULTISPECIES: hypothetical protein [Streptomyces]|uniref:DUF2690 domain-containing protein n=1 Tax=Streptomyces cacaoi TaxID=1898 RepID=A0A4Y3R2V1_STRCI|nr:MULTISPECIES: hypothetical protein [Streptomyces]NNG86615.1 hypothetical protein [Streptomyces cacaoi]QHF93615.1 hypothetical protein DEH18_06710 [Streptomyces sp. NHF165]GEB51093.1 hypothetical protein SCA03_36440 [Streptomyces cacaoi]
MRISLSSKAVVAAAACAVAVLPAGAASAGDGPKPQQDEKATTMSTAPAPEGNPHSRTAQASGVCSDAYQIGNKRYIKRKGQVIGTVRQFYSPSCNRNYGYLWVWQSFRNTHKNYATNIAVYDFNTKKLVGLRQWHRTNAQEFWSGPAATVRHCTAARGMIKARYDSKQSFAYSSKRC